MTFAAQMRVGSLEILAALALFGVIARRLDPQVLAPRRKAQSVSLGVMVRDAPGVGGTAREVTLTLNQGSPTIIGRSSQAQIGLLDPEVSRRHARFDLTGGVLYVSDCGSSNGTFLNGKRVAEEGIEVRTGDDIDVGNTRISLMRMEPASWT